MTENMLLLLESKECFLLLKKSYIFISKSYVSE